MVMNHLFIGREISKAYSIARPEIPQNVLDYIINYCSTKKFCFKRVVDVGCGTGKSTFSFCHYFTEVIGLDPSQSQLEEAGKLKTSLAGEIYNKIKFHQSQAEDMSVIESGSVNLIVVGNAIHWFNQEQFYKEVDRVLVLGGVLAVYANSKFQHLDNEDATAAAREVIYKKFEPYFLHGSRMVFDNYEAVHLPYSDKRRITSFKMEQVYSLPNFLSYVKSLSVYPIYMQQNPNSNILDELYERLRKIYQNKPVQLEKHHKGDAHPSQIQVKATWHISLLLARKEEWANGKRNTDDTVNLSYHSYDH